MPNLLKTWSFFKGTKKEKKTFTRPLTQNKKKKLRSPSPVPSTRKNPRPLRVYVASPYWLYLFFIFKIVGHLFWSRLMGGALIGVPIVDSIN
jgi:hypothetical protein